MGLQEVGEHIIDGESLNLPSGDNAPGRLLSGEDELLDMDKEIDQDEVADLLDDAERHEQPQEVVPIEDEVFQDDNVYSEGGSDEDNPPNCEEDFEEEPEIRDDPELVLENDEPNDEEASGRDADEVGGERPRRNVALPERYNPETGL